jgi:4-amino-4-deoxy-L-arabinose transferase-like glycosyltransferase
MYDDQIERSSINSAKFFMKTTQFRYYWLAAFCLLLFWISRTYNLLTLPLFLDEATHLTRAQWVWEGRPFYLLETGKALAPYVAALFWPYTAAPFIGRYIVVLFGALGLASAFAVGRELHSRQAGLLGMALWLVCPQMFFYERMALVDTTMSAMAMLALWLAIRMIRTGNPRTAILCGVGLALVVIAKLTGLVFLPIPFLVTLLLTTSQTWRRRIRQMVIAYVVAGILLIGPLASIWAVASDPTGQSLISTDVTTMFERLGSNAATSWDAEKIYHSEVMLWVLLVSATFAVCFRRGTVGSC